MGSQGDPTSHRQGQRRMSIPHLIRQIRALPYNDMMMVANELRDRIDELTHHKIEAGVLADILSRLQAGTVKPSDATLQEEKILREIFSRKRQITVSRKGNGWEIDVPSLLGAQVLGTELRPMFQMQLDQIITMHVLSKR